MVLDPSDFLAPGAMIYFDANCTVPEGPNPDPYGYAITSEGQTSADAICAAGNPEVIPAPPATLVGPDLYVCGPPG